jgi:hypothetical protein
MRAPTLPSVATLEANDDPRLASELRVVHLRTQAAIVRTLADHVERFARVEDMDGLGDQLAEEIARLGCRLLDAAASMTMVSAEEASGVFLRLACADTASRSRR